MKILFVINTMGRGGAEIQVMDLAFELVRRGHEVGVVVLLPFEDFEARMRAGGIETFTLNLKRGTASPRAFVELQRILREFAPDVLHGHLFGANMAARVAGVATDPLRRRFSIVNTAHTPVEVPRRYLAYRATARACDRFTFVSDLARRAHEDARALPAGTGVVIPNGVHLSRFQHVEGARARLRNELGLGNAFTWLAAGSFRDEAKDYSTLLRAFRALADEQPNVRLLIAGEGALLDAKVAEARTLGLERTVQFLGLRQDVSDLMAASDGYVMSSAWEGLPIVLLEAAAAEMPIVVTDVGANRLLLGDGRGVIVPPKDPAALSAAVRAVARWTPEERVAMGRRARAHVQANFAIDRVVDMWEELYRDGAARRPRRA